MEVAVKKEGWSGGGVRQIKVLPGNGDATIIKIAGKVLQVMIGPGLPSTTSTFLYNSKHSRNIY